MQAIQTGRETAGRQTAAGTIRLAKVSLWLDRHPSCRWAGSACST